MSSAAKNNKNKIPLNAKTWPLVKRLLSENFREHIWTYAIGLFFMVMVAGSTAMMAWIMRDVVESLFVVRDFDKILAISLLVMAIFLVKGLATYGQIVILARVGNAIIAKMQMRLYRKLLQQDGDFYVRYPSHDLMTRIGENAKGARMVIELIVTSLGRDLITLIALVAVMLFQDPLLSLIALVIAPPVIFIVTNLVRRVRKVAKQLFDSSVEVLNVMRETSFGIRIVKSFSMEDVMTKRMEEAVDQVRLRNNKIASLTARTSPVMETLGGFCIGLMILYAGWQIAGTEQTPAEFMAFLTALLLAYEPAKRIARVHIGLEAGLVSVRLMYEILDAPLDIPDRADAKELVLDDGKITFKRVTFSYRASDDEPETVLKDVDFVAEGGAITALVGPSGSGKSTMIHLIQRFYEVETGQIEVDGQDIRTLTKASLRDKIAFVSQDTFLFAGTVMDNIRAGRPEASDEEVFAAARDANAHNFISTLPLGYGTELGENGSGISGGQRQRIAIARAILKDAPIVLLDEATSALDTESEKLVQQAFDRLQKGRTTIVIAHRLSTITNAHRIYVLNDGEVLESGTHNELLEKGSAYDNLFKLQFQGGRIEAAQ